MIIVCPIRKINKLIKIKYRKGWRLCCDTCRMLRPAEPRKRAAREMEKRKRKISSSSFPSRVRRSRIPHRARQQNPQLRRRLIFRASNYLATIGKNLSCRDMASGNCSWRTVTIFCHEGIKSSCCCKYYYVHCSRKEEERRDEVCMRRENASR